MTKQLTKIDYGNLYAEIVTIPELLNRLGALRADAQARLAEEQLKLSIRSAQLAEYYRKDLVSHTTDSKGNPKVKEPTQPMVDNHVRLDPARYNMKKKVIRYQKEYDYVDALYWAAKSKSDKLDKISEKMNLSPEQFAANISTGVFNTVEIQVFNNQ